MDSGMTKSQWLSLGLLGSARPVFEEGNLRTIKAAGNTVVGIPRHDAGHHLLGTAASRGEAVVIATMLRLFNPG